MSRAALLVVAVGVDWPGNRGPCEPNRRARRTHLQPVVERKPANVPGPKAAARAMLRALVPDAVAFHASEMPPPFRSHLRRGRFGRFVQFLPGRGDGHERVRRLVQREFRNIRAKRLPLSASTIRAVRSEAYRLYDRDPDAGARFLVGGRS